MKRFLIFRYEWYYPSGGWNDFYGDAETLEEAKTFVDAYLKHDNGGAHVVDTQTWKKVYPEGA